MRWVVLFISVLLPSWVVAEEIEVIKKEATECREYIAEIGLHWPTVPWDCREEIANSLSQALQYGLEFWGADNPGYRIGANNPACKALIDAGLEDCNYNIRMVLVGFLAMYGVDLFPADLKGVVRRPGSTSYTGEAEANEVLVEVVRRNADLLADGDLTAEEVTFWH